ncbi:hypothetical protein HID58_014596 [Brassica napus]|uniref:Uncharacterized protein n=1 Tax=Brassica napus TaxID=3708 RepID=A0ABQ8DHM3_BRANA|nr:hypothetical protein HID58_014596 [Brassica napus]
MALFVVHLRWRWRDRADSGKQETWWRVDGFRLLLDAKVIITPATVNVNRLTTFRDRLKAGSIFSATGFDVTRCNITSDSHDSPLAIRFVDSTALDELTELKTPIPEERLRFRDHRELLGLANTNTHLPDQDLAHFELAKPLLHSCA